VIVDEMRNTGATVVIEKANRFKLVFKLLIGDVVERKRWHRN
jgi:hypothetical protein